jgi:hypothetical protein
MLFGLMFTRVARPSPSPCLHLHFVFVFYIKVKVKVKFIHQSAHHARTMPPGIFCGHAVTIDNK